MVALLDRDGNIFDGYAVYPAASAPSPPRSLLEMSYMRIEEQEEKSSTCRSDTHDDPLPSLAS